jgi:uncharacterized integral membrane protein
VAYSQRDNPGRSTEPNWLMRALGATSDHGIDKHRLVGVVLVLVALLLILQNTKSTGLHFLFFTFQAPIWIMAVATLVAGAAAWELLKRGHRRRQAEAMEANHASSTGTPPLPPPPPTKR